MVPSTCREAVLSHFAFLDFWRPHWADAAVVLVGSAAAGFADEFSDTDLLVFVPAGAYGAIYDRYAEAIPAGRVQALNPEALHYREFPLVRVPGVDGHYKVEPFEETEDRIAAYDDVGMWIHQNSLVLHDPSERYAALREKASCYPEKVWREKLRDHLLAAVYACGAAGNPLRRGDHAGVLFTMTGCLAHLLRLCCMLDRKPFPYDKWLYRAALETRAGRDLKGTMDGLIAELRRADIRREPPAERERPWHRNADLEDFPLYRLFREARRYFDAHWPSAPD